MPSLDAAISKFLDSQRDDYLNSVIAFGRPALDRVLNLYYRSRDKDVAPLTPKVTAPQMLGGYLSLASVVNS
jgi:hypothetical protein